MPRNRKNNKKEVKLVENQMALVGPGSYSSVINSLGNKIDKIDRVLRENPIVSKTVKKVAKRAINRMPVANMAKLFGFGDYEVKHNSLINASNGLSGNEQVMVRNVKNGIRIVEREFIGDIVSSGTIAAFKNDSFTLNPADSTTFPWLSQLAKLFDQWEPNGIVFEFISSSSEFNGNSQALGTVIMATEYDTEDPKYGTKQEMEASEHACSTKPSNNLVAGVECDPGQRPMKIMYINPVATDPRFSELGKFQIATTGISTPAAVLGELWISYDITFYKKQMLSNLLFTAPYYGAVSMNVGSGASYWANFNPNFSNTLRITTSVLIGSYVRFYFPADCVGNRYVITLRDGNDTNSTALQFNYIGAAELNSIEGTAVANEDYIRVSYFTILSATAYIEFPETLVGSGETGFVQIWITQIDPNSIIPF